MLHQFGPDLSIILESWEQEKKQIKDVLKSNQFKTISYYRKSKSPGGGAAIIYNESRFSFVNLHVPTSSDIECVWALCTPKHTYHNVKRIAVGGYYVSPRARNKQEIIEHIIDTIHFLRAQYDNQINFLIGGDFNRLKIDDILDCYGALKQVCSVPTRSSAILEIVLTDLHTLYHPPTTLPPLQVDADKIGKDSDHNIVLFAPKKNLKFKKSWKKKVIKTRPIPESQVAKFVQELAIQPWEQLFLNKSVNDQADVFHNWLRNSLEKYFPEKETKMSSLDKKWMTPQLKQIHRSMSREYCKHRRSEKYKKLKSKYKRLKRKSVQSFYSDFVQHLKKSNPGKWFKMAKKIGAISESESDEIKVESLSELSNRQCAQEIAQHFAAISNQYSPINPVELPAYLPAPLPPQVEEYDVYLRIKKLRKTKTTLPIDIPAKLRHECSPYLAAPVSIIINSSLSQSIYPDIWKQEWVTPAPKITHPKEVSDLRKISCTSEYSKVYEGFLKDWILEDIQKNIDIGQFGGQSGIGTEHMIVCLLDRILHLLDSNPDRSAVIATCLDWSQAFDRQDPTIAIQKFIKLGVRPSLIPLLVSYLTDRRMKVKFNGESSDFLALVGGGPQGTLVGGLEYMAQSNDNADIVPPKDRFKFIDDLSILQLICFSGLLLEYNFKEHVASDIGIGQLYLPASSYDTQPSLDYIAQWTKDNLMKLNVSKCNYMIFSRSKTNFATRLKIENQTLEKINATKILGVWISEDLSWSKNCQVICQKAYSRMSMITKLKYAGVSFEDLIEIYILFIRSVVEYCAVAFHSTLTQEQSRKLEKIQKTCLKVILGDMYIDYTSALEMCGLQTLSERRQARCLDFALKCIKHERNQRLFPLSEKSSKHYIRDKEIFHVNFARTEDYKKSTIPYCQRLLNNHFNGD